MSKLKSLLVAALLALAIPSAAQAQGCGSPNPNCIVPTAPPGTSTNQAASTAFVQGAVTTAAPGGSVGQQQYKAGAATFGGFTQSGDVTVNTSTGVATIRPNAVTTSKILNGNVTNTKLAPGAANTLKGSLDGITTSDLAIASCSALYNLLSGCQALAGSAASIRCCHHARSPRRSIRRRSPRSPRSAIRMCDTFTSTSHFFALCDVNWHTACFGTVLRNLQLAARTSVASSSAYMVYSNNTQDSGGIDNVYIYAGTRGCVHFEKGYGGASRASIDKLSCTALSTLPMVWMGNTTGSGVNFGSTILALRDIVLGGPSSGGTYQTGPGFLLNGGFPRIENSRCENMASLVPTQVSARRV